MNVNDAYSTFTLLITSGQTTVTGEPTSFINKKAQLLLTNPHDAWNPGHGSLKGIKSDTIR